MAKHIPSKCWQLTPFVGVGPLTFGLSRRNVRELLGSKYEEFKKGPFATNMTDAFDDFYIHVYYDENDKLENIDAFGDANIQYRNLKLLNQPITCMLQQLAELGLNYHFDLGSYVYKGAGIAFYVEGDIVKAVTAARPGYFD